MKISAADRVAPLLEGMCEREALTMPQICAKGGAHLTLFSVPRLALSRAEEREREIDASLPESHFVDSRRGIFNRMMGTRELEYPSA